MCLGSLRWALYRSSFSEMCLHSVQIIIDTSCLSHILVTTIVWYPSRRLRLELISYTIFTISYFLLMFLSKKYNNITRNLCLTSSWPIVLMIKRKKIFKVVNWFVTTLIKTFFQSSNTFKDLEINVSGNALEVVKRIIMRLFHAVAKFILTIKMKSEESKR